MTTALPSGSCRLDNSCRKVSFSFSLVRGAARMGKFPEISAIAWRGLGSLTTLCTAWNARSETRSIFPSTTRHLTLHVPHFDVFQLFLGRFQEGTKICEVSGSFRFSLEKRTEAEAIHLEMSAKRMISSNFTDDSSSGEMASSPWSSTSRENFGGKILAGTHRFGLRHPRSCIRGT